MGVPRPRDPHGNDGSVSAPPTWNMVEQCNRRQRPALWTWFTLDYVVGRMRACRAHQAVPARATARAGRRVDSRRLIFHRHSGPTNEHKAQYDVPGATQFTSPRLGFGCTFC